MSFEDMQQCVEEWFADHSCSLADIARTYATIMCAAERHLEYYDAIYKEQNEENMRDV